MKKIRQISKLFVYGLLITGYLLPQIMLAQVGPNPGGDIEAEPIPQAPGIGPNPGGEIEEPEDDVHGDPSDPSVPPPSSTDSSAQTGSTGATEPPIKLEVLDCPGVVREINAANLPPSIYPKPNCGPGTPGAGSTNGPTGICTTDPNIQAYGISDTAPPDGSIFWTIMGTTTGSIGQGFGPTPFAMGDGAWMYDDYNYTLGVQGHPGVDINGEVGQKLYTPVAGTVITDGGTPYFYDDVGPGVPYTGELKIELDNGDHIVIGHMSTITVRKGDKLQPGQYVGDVGSNGGAHMHLEYRLNQSHSQGSHLALDPRDVFGCASPGSETDSTTPPADGQSGPTVQGASTRKGQVLQSGVTVSPDFPPLQEKYGLDPVTGPSEIDFEANRDNIALLRDHAIKYAPMHDVDPEFAVMWALTETLPPYDSYSYSNCNETYTSVLQECGTIGSGDWQVGYGQQYAVYPSLDKAFEAVYGDPNNASKVQEVGQNVLQKSGDTARFPRATVGELLSSESANRKWIFALMRDQPISIYLVAQELAGDLQNAANHGYGNRLWDFACDYGWGAAYCAGHSYRERFSNTINDILLNWGISGSGSTGDVCQVGVSSTTSNCSTIADNLNGMDVEEFVRRINENMPTYKKISQCADVPWAMMAAIHLRETSLKTSDIGAGGPWQFHPEPTDFDAHDFEKAGCEAAKLLAGKIEQQFGDDGLGPLRAEMDPSKKDDEYSIKAAFFGYNGTGGWEPNVEKGCTPGLDGNDAFNWDCSAYVMNNMDSNHTGMCVMGLNPNQEEDDLGPQLMCPPTGDPGNDGVWKVYYKLHFSTFGSDGELLVYGGQCDLRSEVVDGYAAPTSPGKAITSQFWAPYPWDPNSAHEGIDIGNQEGDPVFAFADGEIITSDWSDDGGWFSILHIPARGDKPEMWVYTGHLDPHSLINTDDGPVPVKAGQQIAKTGGKNVLLPGGGEGPNGKTTDPHLHFDIRLSAGDPPTKAGHVNPCDFTVMQNTYPDLQCTE